MHEQVLKEHFINVVVLAVLLVGTLLSWSWPWGVLFIYWTLPAWSTGRVFLVGDIEREKQPTLYWSVLAFWVLGGVAMIITDPMLLKLVGFGGGS